MNVPLWVWLGEAWGWRAVFLLGAGVAASALIVQAGTLPTVAAAASARANSVGSVAMSGSPTASRSTSRKGASTRRTTI